MAEASHWAWGRHALAGRRWVLAGGLCPQVEGLQRRAATSVVLGWQGGDGPLIDMHLLSAIQVEEEPQALGVPREGTAVCADVIGKWGPPGS